MSTTPTEDVETAEALYDVCVEIANGIRDDYGEIGVVFGLVMGGGLADRYWQLAGSPAGEDPEMSQYDQEEGRR